MSFFWNALLVLNSFLVLLNIHILSFTYIYEAVKFLFYLVFVFSFFQISIRYRAKNYGQIKIKKYNIYKKYLKDKKYKNGTHLTVRRFFNASVSSVFNRARGLFLESPDRAVDVYMKDRGFNSFASYMRKLSVTETKWTILLANPRSYSFYIDFNIWFRARRVIGTLKKRVPGLPVPPDSLSRNAKR